MSKARYTLSEREAWCKAYLEGKRVETPEGVARRTFVRELRDWARKYAVFGVSAIDPSVRGSYSPEAILAAAEGVAEGKISTKAAARKYGIKDKRTVRRWARLYRQGGEDALESVLRRYALNAGKRETAEAGDEGIRPSARSVRAGERAAKVRDSLLKKIGGLGGEEGRQPRPSEKAQAIAELLISDEGKGTKLRDLLSIAGLSKSTYFYCLRAAAKGDKDAELSKEIASIHASSGEAYGVRRIAATLRAKGIAVGNWKVNRLMRELGISGRQDGRAYTSYRGGEGKKPQLLLVEYERKDGTIHHKSDFSCDRPDQKWTTDVSQFNLSDGTKCYLSAVKDMFTGEIIAYDLSTSPNMAQVLRMLKRAFRERPRLEGLLLHSDQGWQYMNKRYQRKLEKAGILQSMSRKGNCYDNSIMESLFGRIKQEMFYKKESKYPDFKTFSKAFAEYVKWYNEERIREACGWKSPLQFRREWEASHALQDSQKKENPTQIGPEQQTKF